MQERKRLAAIFTSFAILIFGTASLLKSMVIDYYTVLNTLEKVIPASIVIGALGWVMGMILDQPKRAHRLGYSNAFINDLLKKSSGIETLGATEHIDPEAPNI